MLARPNRSINATPLSPFALWDSAAWLMATLCLVVARYDFSLNGIQWAVVMAYGVTAAATQLLVGMMRHLYQGRHPVGSYSEAVHLSTIALVIGVVAGIAFSLASPGFPRGVIISVPLGAIIAMAAGRFVGRAMNRRQIRAMRPKDPERILVYGAGSGGRILGRMLLEDAGAPYEIVGYIDDDPAKQHAEIVRVRVLGTGSDLLRVAAEEDVLTVLLAIPSAPSELVRRVSTQAEAGGLTLLTLPKVADIVGGAVDVAAIRRISVADILGRGQVTTDLRSISDYVNGKAVLVTGAGGSIGSELALQLHRLGPAELILLDRDESALHAVQLSIYHQGLLDTRDMVLCDIRDAEALDRVFLEHRPNVVFHAAALKHLPMLEAYPSEAWKTNVLGTLNVLEAARRHGVDRFVNISTDKAADPISVLGKTKRLAEQLTSWFAHDMGSRYVSVRFGNVLGSRGSVLHTFYKQIEQGGPLTVVHPDITRYFMTIPEACQLTIQAGAIGTPGDVMVLDMGEPMRILDVAQRLIRESGRKIEIIFTGLRPGEKLHESLFNDNETAGATAHPLISQVAVPPVEPATVRGGRPGTFLAGARVGVRL
jgi:FlaA1/EpsC-like NDP-sugar epimerase